MLLPEGSPECLLEDLHFDPLDIVPQPFVEEGAKEMAQSFSRHRTGAHTPLILWLGLHQGKKLDGLGFDLLEEAVNLDGIQDVLGVHDAKEIARDMVLAQALIPAHCLPVSRLCALGDAVPIVHFLWAIETEPYAEALSGQETAPIVIKERPVGLYSVRDVLARGLVLALQLDNLAKVVQPQNGRFTPVPGEVDHRTGGSLNVLDNVRLEDVVRHAK